MKPKIIYSEIVRSPQFYYDENERFYPEATVFIMTGSHMNYICNLLNSNLIAFIFKKFYAGGGLGEEGYRYKKQFIEKLPLPKGLIHIDDEILIKTYGFNSAEIEFIQSQYTQ